MKGERFFYVESYDMIYRISRRMYRKLLEDIVACVEEEVDLSRYGSAIGVIDMNLVTATDDENLTIVKERLEELKSGEV